MDTNNWNKCLIGIKMLHVNTSFSRFWSDMGLSERNFILNERDGLWSLFRLERCPCTHLFQSRLPGWSKISLPHMSALRFPARKALVVSLSALLWTVSLAMMAWTFALSPLDSGNFQFLVAKWTLRLLGEFVQILLSLWKWGDCVQKCLEFLNS